MGHTFSQVNVLSKEKLEKKRELLKLKFAAYEELMRILQDRAENQKLTVMQRDVAFSVYRMVFNAARMINFAIDSTEYLLKKVKE